MWGLVPVKGGFSEISGSGTVSPTGEVTGSLTVAAASIDTKLGKRDAHLRSADFFDVERYPGIEFTVQGVAGATVTGSLTVHGQTKPLSFAAEVSVPNDDGVQVDAQVRVNRGDFGMTWNRLGMTSMHSTITVHAVFTRQA
jgi:polyisoprenoid-binding protein YceI